MGIESKSMGQNKREQGCVCVRVRMCAYVYVCVRMLVRARRVMVESGLLQCHWRCSFTSRTCLNSSVRSQVGATALYARLELMPVAPLARLVGRAGTHWTFWSFARVCPKVYWPGNARVRPFWPTVLPAPCGRKTADGGPFRGADVGSSTVEAPWLLARPILSNEKPP